MKKFTFHTTIHCTLDISVIAEDYEEATDRLNDRVHDIDPLVIKNAITDYEENLTCTSDEIDELL